MNFWNIIYFLYLFILQHARVRAMGTDGGPVFVEAVSDFRWDLTNVSR